MQNLTLAIEDQILLEARKFALEQGTSVNQMVRDYLAGLAGQRDQRRLACAALKAAFRKGVGEMPRNWKREDLYDRRL